MLVVDADEIPGRMHQQPRRAQVEPAERQPARRVGKPGRVAQLHLADVQRLAVEVEVQRLVEEVVGEAHPRRQAAGAGRIAILRVDAASARVGVQVRHLVELARAGGPAAADRAAERLPGIAHIARLRRLRRGLPHGDGTEIPEARLLLVGRTDVGRRGGGGGPLVPAGRIERRLAGVQVAGARLDRDLGLGDRDRRRLLDQV
jgi:hypothetical protein